MTRAKTDWKECLLGDLVTLKRGYDLPLSQRHDGPYPVVTSSGVTGFHNTAKVKGPGVVTGRYGTLGVVHYVENDYWPHNTALYVCDFKGSHPKFISYFLGGLDFNAQNAAAAVPGVNRNFLHLIPVRVPPVPIQHRIAGILSAYDDLIENNMRRLQILERMAQAFYREWFVDFRFPGEAKVKLVESPLGKIPQGWSVRRLDEVAAVNALSIRRGQEPDGILYVDIASVTTGRIEKIEEMAFASAPGRARRIVRHGDTIWSCVRPNRKSFSLILNPPTDLIVSTGFAVITPASAPFSFLHQALTTDDFVGYLTNHATGAAYPAVTAKDFEAAKMLVPDEPLVRRFHEHCEPMLLLKENLLRKSANLRRTRDLLLPKLISGALDVSKLDIETACAPPPTFQ